MTDDHPRRLVDLQSDGIDLGMTARADRVSEGMTAYGEKGMQAQAAACAAPIAPQKPADAGTSARPKGTS
jgi:hypothetical protein